MATRTFLFVDQVGSTAGRDDDALLRGARLAAVEDWRTDHQDDLTATEREYLGASTDLRTRELRRARRTTRRFQVLAAVLVVLFAGAAVATGIAVSSSRTATRRATEATSRGLAAQAAAVAGTRVDTALLLAVEAFRRDPSIDSRTGLLTALNATRHLVGYRRDLPADAIDIDVPPDRSALAVLTSSGDLQLLDPDSGRPRGQPLVTGIDQPFYMNYSPDGSLLGYVDAPGIRVVDLVTGQTLGTVPDEGLGLLPVVRPGADEIAVAAANGLEPVRRYRFDGTMIGQFAMDPEQVWGLTFSPDGSRLVVTDADAVTTLYDADQLTAVGRPITSLGARIGDAAFSPDGSAVALAADDGSVRIASTEDGTVLADVGAFPTGGAVTFLAADRLLAVSPGGAAEFDLSSLTALGTSVRLAGSTPEVLPLPGGVRAVIGQGTELAEVDPSGAVRLTGVHLEVRLERAMALSPDGERIATLGYPADALGSAGDPTDPLLVIADRATGATLTRTRVEDPAATGGGGVLQFSPDGRLLAVGTYGRLTSFVDTATGEVLRSRRTDVAAVSALLWSPDGKILYEGGQDGVLRSLDPRTGEDVASVA